MTTTPTPQTCPGCSQSVPVKAYRARFTDAPDTFVPVLYCDDCADLAAVNWSGTVLEVGPA